MAAILRLTITADTSKDIVQLDICGHLWYLTLDSLDIHHPCYGQLTPVKTRYPLTSITWPYCGLKSSAHRGQLFFFKLTADQVLVSNWIAGSSPAKTRLDAVSTSSSKHLYSSLRSTLLVFRWNTVLKKPLFPAFSAVLIENRLDIIVYGFAREKIVWFGKVLIMQALSSDVAVY